MKKRDSTISKKYIITISVVFSILIITTALLFNTAMNRSGKIMKKTVKMSIESLYRGKINNVSRYLELNKPKNLKEIKELIGRYCGENRGFLYVFIFQKTGDDNFFRVVGEIPLEGSLSFQLDRRKYIREDKEQNYLRRALLSPVADPVIYTTSNIYWNSLYSSYRWKRKSYIIQYLVSASDAYHLLEDYAHSVALLKRIMAIISFVLVVVVSILTVVFVNNYSLLLSNLSRYMNKAANGEYDINIKKSDDSQLNELASSFNSLVDELKDKSTVEPLVEIFRKGVEHMKEERLEEAVNIFRTMILLKPEGHGSFFNLGVAYAKLKRYGLSLEMFQKAKELKPDFQMTEKYIEKVEKLISLDA